MSRQISVDGTPYTPRRGGSGVEAPLKKVRNRAEGMLRARRLTDREKGLIRAALTELDELRILVGQACEHGTPADLAPLEKRRMEVMSLLSLLLTKYDEARRSAPGRMMTRRPQSR